MSFFLFYAFNLIKLIFINVLIIQKKRLNILLSIEGKNFKINFFFIGGSIYNKILVK